MRLGGSGGEESHGAVPVAKRQKQRQAKLSTGISSRLAALRFPRLLCFGKSVLICTRKSISKIRLFMTPEKFIKQEEGRDGLQPDGTYKAVWDKLGLCWSIGPGLTKGITRDTRMTQAEADAAFEKELQPFERVVDGAVKVGLGQNERSALVSFAYNCGSGAFLGSTLLRKLNAGNYNAVPSELMKWVHAAGASGPVPGLINRRRAEVVLWGTHDEAASPASSNPSSISVPKSIHQDTKMTDTPTATISVPASTLKTAANVSSTTVKASLGLASLGALFTVAGPIAAAFFPSTANWIAEIAACLPGLGVAIGAVVHALHLSTSAEAVTNAIIDSVTGAATAVTATLGEPTANPTRADQ